MAKTQEKMQAQQLRKKGFSVSEIAKKLDVSKGSVSAWCSEIILTKAQSNRIRHRQIKAGAVGRERGAEANRQKRLQAIVRESERAKKMLGSLSKRDLFMVGIGLY
jgi:predicted transcriptional regulator